MIGTFLAGALLMASDPGSIISFPSPPQETPSQSVQAEADPITLEGIDVVGRPLTDLIRGFVNEVAAPNRGRNLARWDTAICVGVVNLETETAQYLADRISTVAGDLGLRVGAPGCASNILIVATDDGNGMAQAMAEEYRRTLRPGGEGMDQGSDAFSRFQTVDRPVRWWQVAQPTDSETGVRATRVPGECFGMCSDPGSNAESAPLVFVFSASRLNTQIVENIIRTIVIVDLDDVAGLSALQLADYIAMVTLAQVDPDAEISGYASILNVFDDPTVATSLTHWDQAYLEGLYAVERNAAHVRSNHAAVVSSIGRARERLRADESVTQD